MEWYFKVLNQFADFSGRARRKEYWMFALFNVLFTVAALILDKFMDIGFNGSYIGWIYILYSLAIFIPSLAVTVRRLHDVGKSGWMYLIILIPIIGAIWLLVLMATDGQPGTNSWGPNPKEQSE
ncbi:DUF805 domain-containing protein [Candidatus Pollutiaquabacter sp.]|uniref:DUF805 domain-containing protein n=1 Tax=Candidatus Pollutiaquabacter sp. TaxID=3416354 RepID=UPI003CC37143|nr:DUF805 domain-containing protein [Bacteroidota bacterium]